MISNNSRRSGFEYDITGTSVVDVAAFAAALSAAAAVLLLLLRLLPFLPLIGRVVNLLVRFAMIKAPEELCGYELNSACKDK